MTSMGPTGPTTGPSQVAKRFLGEGSGGHGFFLFFLGEGKRAMEGGWGSFGRHLTGKSDVGK